jgi:hypothetical protein
MKKSPLLLTFLGVAILVFTVMMIGGIYEEILAMNGFHKMNKVSAAAKNKTPDSLFTLRDMDKLKEELGSVQLAYSALTNIVFKNEGRQFHTKISGVNPCFRNFTDISIIRGSFFTCKENECRYVAVIDANLAWDMFNSVDIIGKEIELYEKKFEVVGVYQKYNFLDDRSNENLIERFTNDGLSNIYIPVNTLLENDPNILIDTVFVETDSEKITGEMEDGIGDALKAIGKWTPNYEIVDFNKSKVLLEQKPEIIVLILALILLLMIAAYLKNEMVKLYGIIQENRKDRYISGVITSQWRRFALQAAKGLIGTLFAVCILLSARFPLYISPEYLNEDLTDTEYYVDLFDSKIQEYNQSLNVEKSQLLRECNMADKLTNLLFFIAILVGIPLVRIGIRQFLLEDTDIFHAACFCSGFFCLSMLSAFITLGRLGLPYTLDMKSAGIIWVYVLASIIYAYYKKENAPVKAEALVY